MGFESFTREKLLKKIIKKNWRIKK